MIKNAEFELLTKYGRIVQYTLMLMIEVMVIVIYQAILSNYSNHTIRFVSIIMIITKAMVIPMVVYEYGSIVSTSCKWIDMKVKIMSLLI